MKFKRTPVTKHGASRYLRDTWGIIQSARTLDNKAWSGGGPRYYKAGARRIYDLDDLDEYAVGELGEPRRSTSDASRAPTITE